MSRVTRKLTNTPEDEKLRELLINSNKNVPIAYDAKLDSLGYVSWENRPKITLRSSKLPAFVLAHELGHLKGKDDFYTKYIANGIGAIGNTLLKAKTTAELADKLIHLAIALKERRANHHALRTLQSLGASPEYIKRAKTDYDNYVDGYTEKVRR